MDQRQINYIFDKRFCEFGFSCLGRRAQITFQDRSKGSGNFFTAHPISGDFIVKDYEGEGCSKTGKSESRPNRIEQESKIIKTEDFVYFTIENVEKLPIIEEIKEKGKGKNRKDKFKTDVEISGDSNSSKKNLVK